MTLHDLNQLLDFNSDSDLKLLAACKGHKSNVKNDTTSEAACDDNEKHKAIKDEDEDFIPILHGIMQIKHGTPKGKRIRILVDLGSTHKVIDEKLCQKLRVKKMATVNCTVPGKGIVKASSTCNIHLELPQLSPTLSMQKSMTVSKDLSTNCDMMLIGFLMVFLCLIVRLHQSCPLQ